MRDDAGGFGNSDGRRVPNGAREALVLMTPLAVAADGALALLAIPLIPLVLVVMRDLQTLPIRF